MIFEENNETKWKRVKTLAFKAQYSENADHGIQSHHFMANRWETVETVLDIFFSSKITAGDCKTMELKDTYSLEEKLWPT